MKSVLLMLSGLTLWAQNEAPVFRATTRLVEFTVIALDKKGNPATDLAKEDFIVTDKGKARPIEFFRFEGGPASIPNSPPPPPNVYSNRVGLAPGPPRNITAIVLDVMNTAAKDQVWARAQVMRHLRVLAPDTRVAFFILGKQLNIVHDFTDDADALRARLAKLGPELPAQSMNDIGNAVLEAEELLKMFEGAAKERIAELLTADLESQLQFNDRVRTQRVAASLAALEGLGRHLAGIPGRKNLVWIGGGISVISITGAMGFGPTGNIRSFEDQIRDTSRRLAQQGVALYIVDAHGLASLPNMSADVIGSGQPRGRGRFDAQQQAETISSDPRASMDMMAAITGGRVLVNSNDMNAGVKAAAADLRGSYSLGFYADGESDSGWHDLKVKVKQGGLNLRYRGGYLAEKPADAARTWTQDQWSAAIFNPLGSSAIHIDVRAQQNHSVEPGSIALLLQVEPNDLYFRKIGDRISAEFDVAFVEKTATGPGAMSITPGAADFSLEQFKTITPASLQTERQWKPAANTTSIRILVVDKYTGTYGAVDLPMKKLLAAQGARKP